MRGAQKKSTSSSGVVIIAVYTLAAGCPLVLNKPGCCEHEQGGLLTRRRFSGNGRVSLFDDLETVLMKAG